MSRVLKIFAAASVVFSALVPSVSLAQDGQLSLQLNTSAQIDANTCRLTYVAFNGTQTPLAQMEYEFGTFDADGGVVGLLLLKFGELPPGKTRILQFGLPNTQCSNVSRIVVNKMAACVDATTGQSTDLCITALNASTRIPIVFDL